MPDKIGFFDLQQTKSKLGYIGALLVTDELGKPEEFRVTYPVKPNAVQRHLYGASLEPHIGVMLCGMPLYQELKHRDELRLIVLSHADYLNLAEHVSCRVVKLARVGEQMSVSEDATQAMHLKSTNQSFVPISAICPSSYDEEMALDTQLLVERFFNNMDLLEPFDRIASALAALADVDTRFQ